jgi:hypothetical protein
MNENEKIRLAIYIADLVVEKLNSQFDFQIRGDMDNELEEILIDDLIKGNTIQDDIEEHLIGELARLTTLLTIYEDKEQYEKAAIIKNKIRIINKKLDND